MQTATTSRAIREEFRLLFGGWRTARRRGIRRFAEEEIVLPRDGGPFEGRRFSCDYQPFTRLLFDEIDSGRWHRFAITGPTQTGKTVLAHTIPVCYGLFELEENVVVGIPDFRMANDKWLIDLAPMIDASPKMRALRPLRGEGSAGGHVKSSVAFRNGAVLRFMSAGGRDTGRAGFTARFLAATEIDNYGVRGESSEETDKVSQLEGRLRAATLTARRIFLECTVTTPVGRIWQEYTGGTESRIACPCPHCGAYVTPEREHLRGWQDAETETDAYDRSRWHCPACDAPITEPERHAMNRRAVLAHRGQTVDSDGRVTGDPPKTFTLGFRWNAFNNLFLSASDIGLDEYKAERSADREAADRKLCQQVHCIPYEPPNIELAPLDPAELARRTVHRRGIVPASCPLVSVGIDTGKWQLHWVACAWRSDGTGFVVDYDRQPVDSRRLGVTEALRAALAEVARRTTWPTESGGTMPARQIWIDSGWHEHQQGVYAFCRQQSRGLAPGREIWRPSKGYAASQPHMKPYLAPQKIGKQVRYLGEQFHLSFVANDRIMLVHTNADHWKARVHNALGKPIDQAGALVLFDAPAHQHSEYIEQITAERQVNEFLEGRGERTRWIQLRRANHFLDATYLAAAAGAYLMELSARPTEPQKWWNRGKQR